MPVVEVKLIEGRTVEQKKNIAERITNALVEEAGVKPEAVTVLFYDLPKTNVANGGVLMSNK